MTTAASLERAITDKSAKVGVIGLGYVGLPLVREFTRGGMRVLGFDIDPGKIKKLKARYFGHLGLSNLTSERLTFEENLGRLHELVKPTRTLRAIILSGQRHCSSQRVLTSPNRSAGP